ncbi:hypothetical protein ACQBAU_18275 [Propionibacteriaceae bacterium Y2011]|uniref:hypothetical protein n=1 Tax=Microlunatus sp. Y2014 TaxID=3418488 RepID=UPI003B4B3588
MGSGMVAAVLCAVGVTAALVVLVTAFVPTTPDLADTLARLHRRPDALTSDSTTGVRPTGERTGRVDRFGGWLLARAGGLPGLAIPYRDLDLLQQTPARFFAAKGCWAVAGLALPSVVAAWAWILGTPLAFSTPVLLALVGAVVGWLVPHLQVRQQATVTRQRFSRTITAYIDLVVLERLSGATLAASIIEPASIADAPLFRRIRQQLSRTQLERKAPWTALRELADAIEVPDLRELADVMELSGTRSAPMAEQLTARAGDIRNTWLTRDVEAQGAASQRQVAATGLLLFCFLIFVGAPALLRLVSS